MGESAETAQTQHLLRDLVEEIRALAGAQLDPKEFYGQFLNRVSGMLGSKAAAVWLENGEGQLSLECHRHLSSVEGLADTAAATRHGRLLEQVRDKGEAMLAAPESAVPGNGEAGNPTGYLLVLAPLKNHRQTVGVIEVFQPAGKSAEIQRGYLAFLPKICEVAEEYLKNRTLQEFDDSQTIWGQLEQFSQAAHSSLRRRETAYKIANEGRRIIQCDRLSVAIWRSGRCRVEAISGQDVFDHRSNVVRQLSQLATCVAKMGEPLWYTGDKSDLSPQIEEALDDFLDQSQSRMVTVLPLQKPSKKDDDEPKSRQQRGASNLVGALILEQFRDTKLPSGFRRRVDAVQQISTLALANAVEHEGHFLAPLSRAIGNVAMLRHRPWAKIALAILLVVILLLVFVPSDFEVEGRGTLEPIQRHDLFAAVDGIVHKVHIRHGDIVKPGQLLVELKNSDLERNIADLKGQQSATAERHKTVTFTLLRERDASELRRLHGERAQLKETLDSLKIQLEKYETKMKQLKVRSPLSGKVVTWDVHDLLMGRPVVRGDMLLSVADVEGEWELEIQMPEDRMGHLVRAQLALGEKLPVTFIMAMEPGVTYEGVLEKIHERAQVHGEAGNTVLIRVSIDKNKLPQLRRGATVIAKVHCGRRSLGYVWFHDLFEFVQSRILFRL